MYILYTTNLQKARIVLLCNLFIISVLNVYFSPEFRQSQTQAVRVGVLWSAHSDGQPHRHRMGLCGLPLHAGVQILRGPVQPHRHPGQDVCQESRTDQICKSMLSYDQKKDINKSETLSIKCVLRLEEKNSFVIFPNVSRKHKYISESFQVGNQCIAMNEL